MTARLQGDLPPEFARPVIDHTRPIRFRLNGRPFTALEGDTVLSALLADGIVTAGTFEGSPLALDEHTAPAVTLAGNEGRPDLAMPMALCPAVDGLSLTTIGPRPRTRSPFLRQRDSLGLIYRSGSAEPGGWIDIPATRHITADVAVVGGGVAGLSAALAAAERGLRACLVEKEATLGGLSVFFGKAEGEPVPEEMIDTLVTRLGDTGLITFLPATLAFDLDNRRLQAIRVARTGTTVQPERISITAETVILATGMVGRLPVFPGNRLPGVVEAGFAWRMAARYNVWPGPSALIHTATNVGYRMALLGAASGKTILRTGDPRVDPQTRFIEFCKAYGYRLGWGNVVASAAPARRGMLAVAMQDAETGIRHEDPVACDRLIVSGGWQPDLDLWLKAAGPVAWDTETQRLVPAGVLDGVVLAGSVAGFVSLAGCVDHGRAALDSALDGEPRSVPDPRIDPMFETPDGTPTLSAPRSRAAAPAFLAPSGAQSLPPPAPRGWKRFLAPRSRVPFGGPFGLLDVVGEIIAGRIDPHFVAGFCAQRCVLPRLLVPAGGPQPIHRHPSDELPAYLDHRFGSGQRQWSLALTEPRRLDPGCLVFANTDNQSPRDAIGVVLSGEPGSVRALIAATGIGSGDVVYVRDGLKAIPARLAEA